MEALADDIYLEGALDDVAPKVASYHSKFTRDKENWSSQLWRLHNIYYVVDKSGNKVLFKPNWAQIELIENVWFLNVILKARQLGFTTFIDILLLDNCCFTANKRAGIICHNREDAQVIFRDKVKFPFDNLPEEVRSELAPATDSIRELVFANNSSIRVGTSLRSGTMNYLHISEYGKLCAKTPEKAREVRTGALNTVQAGQMVYIESTAEGRNGHYYQLCQRAQNAAKLGKTLTPLDYKFHFYPWWQNPEYELSAQDCKDEVIPTLMREYFNELEGTIQRVLSLGQKLWYAKKAVEQGEDMKREFPSTPEEAFAASIEGAYYKKQMAIVRLEKRIRRVPHAQNFPVNTFWDLGFNDNTAIWFHQHIGLEHRFINYVTNSGEGLGYYVQFMQKHGYVWGKHYLPHDADAHESDGTTPRDKLWKLGLRNMEVVERPNDQRDGIEDVRTSLAFCWFDEEKCSEGIEALDHYRKEWDDKLGDWKSTPLHDWASHGAKAFEQFARGYKKSSNHGTKKPRRRRPGAMAV